MSNINVSKLREVIKSFINQTQYQSTIVNLYDRWQDEKQYEDFKDYVNIMKVNIPKGARFIKATKRPFAYTFEYMGWVVTIKVTSKAILWHGIPFNF